MDLGPKPVVLKVGQIDQVLRGKTNNTHTPRYDLRGVRGDAVSCDQITSQERNSRSNVSYVSQMIINLYNAECYLIPLIGFFSLLFIWNVILCFFFIYVKTLLRHNIVHLISLTICSYAFDYNNRIENQFSETKPYLNAHSFHCQ